MSKTGPQQTRAKRRRRKRQAVWQRKHNFKKLITAMQKNALSCLRLDALMPQLLERKASVWSNPYYDSFSGGPVLEHSIVRLVDPDQ